MIKQKSKRDLAGTFRKAALAYGAFRPNNGPGMPKDPNAPDGISAVVPAPSRGMSHDNTVTQSSFLDRKSKDHPTAVPSLETNVPEVTLTANTPDADGRAAPGSSFTSPKKGHKEARVISAGPKSPKRQLTLRGRTPPSDAARHVAALGISPGVIQGSTVDIESVLRDFGCWDGEAGRHKSPETLDAELRREIGRVEAGSWLGQSDERDERVGAVEKLLDRAITECDELEGLLTLYSVELSVSTMDVSTRFPC
jgi:hypothetical protein